MTSTASKCSPTCSTPSTKALWPLLLNVVVEPLGGAQILMIGHVRPGMTLQLDEDLEIRLLQPWFPEPDSD